MVASQTWPVMAAFCSCKAVAQFLWRSSAMKRLAKNGIGGTGDEGIRIKDELDKPSGDHKNYCVREFGRGSRPGVRQKNCFSILT